MTDGAGLNQGPWYLMSFPRHFTALNIFKIKENSVKMQYFGTQVLNIISTVLWYLNMLLHFNVQFSNFVDSLQAVSERQPMERMSALFINVTIHKVSFVFGCIFLFCIHATELLLCSF
jgi:hypothetical protein